MELSRVHACTLKARAKLFQLVLVANGEVNVRGMVVGRTTIGVGVLHGGMACLDSLLREWDIAARDCVEVVFGGLGLHDKLTGC